MRTETKFEPEVIKGKCSWFGGMNDKGMTQLEGLAMYEHFEADLAPTLFIPGRHDLPVWKRLRPDAFYCAYKFDLRRKRSDLQRVKVKLTNPANGRYVYARLVDWGPGLRTGRAWDLSPAAMEALRAKTDDLIEGIEETE